MFHRHLLLSTSLFMLGFTVQPPAIACLDDEFHHFVKHGSSSSNFFSNITEKQDEETKKTLLSLETQEKQLYEWHKKEKEKLCETWRSLSHKEGLDPRLSLIYSNKALTLEWHGETAIKLADECHHYIQQNKDLDAGFATQLAYRGFSALRIHFDEPDYDYHKKLRAAPQVICLLNDLKSSTKGIKTVSELSITEFPIQYFPENDIPQARVCQLLTVAEGLQEPRNPGNIYINGITAINLYLDAFKGSTTPEQRKHYHQQINSLGNDLPVRLMYSLPLKDQFLNDYKQAVKKNTLALIRIYEDELEDIDPDKQPAAWCHLAYQIALHYYQMGEIEKPLNIVDKILNVKVDEKWDNTELFTFLEQKKEEARNFIESINKER